MRLPERFGYPDKWRDYSALKITRASYSENAASARLFEFKRALGKIAKPVDRTEWGMTPPTVNAYYNPSLNEIVFPAGILQPPFYDPNVDDAINYGGIGAVIGHEMTHGFDDSGAKFDGAGNRTNWWTDADLKNFNARTQCVIDQFDGFEVQPGINQKGKLVVGESIADLGGLTVAYAALCRNRWPANRGRRASTASRRSSGSFSAGRKSGPRPSGRRTSACWSTPIRTRWDVSA